MKKQSFIKGSVILLASAVVVKLIGALFKIPLTNMLGGTAMGYFSCAYGIFLPVYAVTGTGLSSAVAKITAENAVKNRSATKRIYHVCMVFFGIMGSLLALALFFGAKRISTDFLGLPQSQTAVALIAPSVLFGCISAVARGYFEGLKNMYPTAVSQVFEAITKLIFGLALAQYVYRNFENLKPLLPNNTTCEAATAAAAILGISLSTLIGAVCVCIFKKDNFARNISQNSMAKITNAQIIGEVICIMLPIALGALVTNLTSIIDLFTINRMLSECISENSEYFLETHDFMRSMSLDAIPEFVFGSYTGLAITIFTLVPSITNMLGKSVLSAASEAGVKCDCKAMQSTADKAFVLTSFIAFPCSFGIFTMAQPILQLLYSEKENEIAASFSSLSLLGLSVIFVCFSCPLFSLLQGASHADVPVKIMLCGVFAKLIGNLVFLSIPQTALFGAALSTLICYLLIFMLSISALRKKCGVIFNTKNIAPFMISGAFCAVCARAIHSVAQGFVPEKYASCIAILCAAAVYFGTLFLHRIMCKKRPTLSVGQNRSVC